MFQLSIQITLIFTIFTLQVESNTQTRRKERKDKLKKGCLSHEVRRFVLSNALQRCHLPHPKQTLFVYIRNSVQCATYEPRKPISIICCNTQAPKYKHDGSENSLEFILNDCLC